MYRLFLCGIRRILHAAREDETESGGGIVPEKTYERLREHIGSAEPDVFARVDDDALFLGETELFQKVRIFGLRAIAVEVDARRDMRDRLETETFEFLLGESGIGDEPISEKKFLELLRRVEVIAERRDCLDCLASGGSSQGANDARVPFRRREEIVGDIEFRARGTEIAEEIPFRFQIEMAASENRFLMDGRRQSCKQYFCREKCQGIIPDLFAQKISEVFRGFVPGRHERPGG